MTKAIEDALNSPLLKNRDVQTSKRFLFNLYYSKKSEHPFMMGEANEITAFMNNFAKDVDVIWGTSVDDTLGDKVKITILASGFEISLSNETTYKPKPRIFGKPKQEPAAASTTHASPWNTARRKWQSATARKRAQTTSCSLRNRWTTTR